MDGVGIRVWVRSGLGQRCNDGSGRGEKDRVGDRVTIGVRVASGLR